MNEAEKLFYTKQKQHYFLDMIEEDIHDISKQLPILRAQIDSSRNDSENDKAFVAMFNMFECLRALDIPDRWTLNGFDESFCGPNIRFRTALRRE